MSQHINLPKCYLKNLEIYIPLPHIINVKNIIQLMKDLLEIPLQKDLKYVSFDVTNMYSSTPVKELIEITELMCNQNDLNKELRCDIIKICKILTKQNYF
jgi:hypothetical protein